MADVIHTNMRCQDNRLGGYLMAINSEAAEGLFTYALLIAYSNAMEKILNEKATRLGSVSLKNYKLKKDITHQLPMAIL